MIKSTSSLTLLVALTSFVFLTSCAPLHAFTNNVISNPNKKEYETAERIKHRRERRKIPNTQLFVANVDDNTNSNVMRGNKEKDSSSSSCPFSMTFPRYRVNLSSKTDTETTKSKNSFLPNPFTPIQEKLTRMQVESKYKQYIEKDAFHWMDCSSSKATWDKENQVVSSQEYQAAAINIRAASYFWRQISNLLSSKEGEMVVVFGGGASKLCVRRLTDILNWYNGQILEGTVPFCETIVEVELDEESAVPAIKLTSSPTKASTTLERREYGMKEEKEEASGEIVQQRIQSWVRRLLVDLHICPFTKSDKRSGQGLGDLGVPVGKISYCYSKANVDCIPLLMADTWKSISEMIDAGPSGKNGISSILLAAPQFDTKFPLWAGPVFAMLESGVSATSSASAIGVVCFHPHYATPDGSSWPGFGHMHSVPRLRTWLEERNPSLSEVLSEEDVAAGGAWQRRTPHAVINVLRAEQLEAAEGRRATGELYAENIRVLVGKDEGVGSEKLAADLQMEQQMESKQ